MPDSPAVSTVKTIALVLVAVFAILAFVGLFLFLSVRKMPGDVVRAGRDVVGDLTDLAAAFREGDVETMFVSYAAELAGSNKLQVAELEQMEIFTRTESSSVLWGALQLPDVVVEARVPVEYVYFVDLDGRWDFSLRGGELVVHAPPLAANMPALDVSELEYVVRESSILRDENAAIESLRAGLTELSRRRSTDNLSLVRETARLEIERFVANWLRTSFDGEVEHLSVVVRNEPRIPAAVDLDRPTD